MSYPDGRHLPDRAPKGPAPFLPDDTPTTEACLRILVELSEIGDLPPIELWSGVTIQGPRRWIAQTTRDLTSDVERVERIARLHVRRMLKVTGNL